MTHTTRRGVWTVLVLSAAGIVIVLLVAIAMGATPGLGGTGAVRSAQPSQQIPVYADQSVVSIWTVGVTLAALFPALVWAVKTHYSIKTQLQIHTDTLKEHAAHLNELRSISRQITNMSGLVQEMVALRAALEKKKA